MFNILEELLEQSDIAVCLKNSFGTVLQQNSECVDICGDVCGRICRTGCKELYATDTKQQWDIDSSRVYRNSFLHGTYYDVTVVCSKNYIITFLQSLGDQYKQGITFYEDKGLTKRELAVISMVIKGLTNVEICGELSISKHTLRSHLNNIYNKVRNCGEELKFLPANRIY